MIGLPLAALVLAASPSICDDVPARRAALDGMEAAQLLDRRIGAPLSSGLAVDGATADAARALGDRLQAFCDAAARADRDVPVDRALLARIYSRPELSRARAPDAGAVARLVDWLTSLLEAYFQTSGAQTFAKGTRFLVLALAFAAAGAAAFRLASTTRRRGERPREATLGATPLELRPPAEHLSRAAAALDADRRLAIREGLLALLAALERRSLARPDRVKTNREVAGELLQRGAPAPVADRATALLHWYDAAYYSLEEPTVQDARRFLQDVGALSTTLAQVAA